MEAVECRNFIAGEFEVEDLCILCDPRDTCGLGDDDGLMLDRPAKQDLRVRAAVLLCNRCYPRVIEPAASGKGGVCFELDPLLSAELEQIALIQKRTELDLVDGGNDG